MQVGLRSRSSICHDLFNLIAGEHLHSHSDREADKPGTGTDTADADADGGTDPGIQQTQIEERTTQAQPQTPRQAAKASNGKVNKDTKRPEFISFSIYEQYIRSFWETYKW